MPTYASVSRDFFKVYAEKNGAEYRFDEDPTFFNGNYANYYHSLRPVFDLEFHKFDRVLYVDMDVFPVEKCSQNIFDCEIGHIGMVREQFQPEIRERMLGPISSKNDMRWARSLKRLWGINAPRDIKNRPLVYNSGVVLYSKEGMAFGRKEFLNIRLYSLAMRLFLLPRFYRLDQNYIGACISKASCHFSELSADWNAQVHYVPGANGSLELLDTRDPSTNFVHLQLRGRRNMSVDDVNSFVKGEAVRAV